MPLLLRWIGFRHCEYLLRLVQLQVCAFFQSPICPRLNSSHTCASELTFKEGLDCGR